MESKRKNVYITIFVITTIIASCVAVYFGIEANRKGAENNTQVGKVESVATDEVEKEETVVEIKEVEKIVEKVVEKGVFPVYDSTKVKSGDISGLSNVYIRGQEPILRNSNIKLWRSYF